MPTPYRESLYAGYRITEYTELGSTNTFLTELAKEGEPGGRVVAALKQSSGKGRRGRSFFSSKPSGVYMSVLYRQELSVNDGLLITPAVACAVAEAIEEVSGRRTGIKWVNDIFADGKKLCGILVESRFCFERDSMDYAVIGIGINLAEPEGGFPDELENIAGVLFDKYTEENRLNIIHKVLEKLNKYLPEIKTRGFLEDYRRRSILIGRTVNVVSNGEAYPAQALGIDDMARLIVELPDGQIMTLDSGEVSVRI